MDGGGIARQIAEEEASPAGSRRADVCLRRRVAALSSPALPGARLTLPGVMDAEGRVDESRLRMHIFKNGRGLNINHRDDWSHVYLRLVGLPA